MNRRDFFKRIGQATGIAAALAALPKLPKASGLTLPEPRADGYLAFDEDGFMTATEVIRRQKEMANLRGDFLRHWGDVAKLVSRDAYGRPTR